MNLTEELERLHTLFICRAITEDEYRDAKAKLLRIEGFEEKKVDDPEPIDWSKVVEVPMESKALIDAGGVTVKEIWKALEVGAVGGVIIGLSSSLARGGDHGSTIVGAAIVGAIVWTMLSLSVKSAEGSRGFAMSFLRLLYSVSIVGYFLSLLLLVGFLIYIKFLANH